jgi:hypothetical protein
MRETGSVASTLMPTRSKDSGARLWLVEQYVPSASTDELRRRVALVRTTVSAMDPAGASVRIVTVTIVPGDEAVLCVVEAPTESVVRDIWHQGGVPIDRISPALSDPD